MRTIKQGMFLWNNKEKKMKKLLVTLLLAGVIVMSFGLVSTANAQGPDTQPFHGQGGRWGGNGITNVDREVNEDVHDLMMAAWSSQLGISVEDLESRVDAGETLSQIVLSTGKTFDEFRTLQSSVMTTVADQALAAGYIDQAQHDWMIQRAERQASGLGGGFGMRGRGVRAMDGTGLGTGRGAGRLGNCLAQP